MAENAARIAVAFASQARQGGRDPKLCRRSAASRLRLPMRATAEAGGSRRVSSLRLPINRCAQNGERWSARLGPNEWLIGGPEADGADDRGGGRGRPGGAGPCADRRLASQCRDRNFGDRGARDPQRRMSARPLARGVCVGRGDPDPARQGGDRADEARRGSGVPRRGLALLRRLCARLPRRGRARLPAAWKQRTRRIG